MSPGLNVTNIFAVTWAVLGVAWARRFYSQIVFTLGLLGMIFIAACSPSGKVSVDISALTTTPGTVESAGGAPAAPSPAPQSASSMKRANKQSPPLRNELTSNRESTSAVTCEDQLKEKMRSLKVSYRELPGTTLAADLSEINQLLNTTTFDPASFKVTYDSKTPDSVKALSVQAGAILRDNLGSDKIQTVSLQKNHSRYLSVNINLMPTPEKSLFLFSWMLSVSVRDKAERSTMMVTQIYNVNSNCEPKLQVTTAQKNQFINRRLKIREWSVFGDGTQAGEQRSTIAEANVPEKFLLDPTVMNFKNSTELNLVMSQYGGETFAIPNSVQSPISKLNYHLADDISHWDRVRNINATFHGFSTTTSSLQGEVLSKTNVYISDESVFVQIDDREIWSLDQAHWQRIHLKKVFKFLNQTVTTSKTYESDSGASMLRIGSNRKLSYENIGAYLKIKKGHGKDFPFLIEARPQTFYDGPSDDLFKNPQDSIVPELASSSAVQITNPTIQTIVQRLLEKKKNRLQMVGEILPELHQLLRFDQTQVDEHRVQILTTTEILERGHGVCQHFANVFAAIARGVGIPTKIVTGYAWNELDEVAAHAWNEIEVREGVWIPLDPEYAYPHFDFDATLPIARGTMYETMRPDESAQEMQSLQFHVIRSNQ